MTTDLPYDLTDEERLLVEVLDAIAVQRCAPACAQADDSGRLDPSLATLLRDQGLLLAGVAELSEDRVRPLLGVLVVERLARVGAAVALLVAGAHDAAAAYEGVARGRLIELGSASAATLADGTGGVVTATADGSLWILNGRIPRVERPDPGAPLVLLATTVEGADAAFELDPATDGATIGKTKPTTGLRGVPVAGLVLHDCAVRDDQRVAAADGVRTALAHRAVSSAALCVGIGAGAHEVASAYAAERRQFGHALCEFPAIEGALLDIETQIAGAAELVWAAARRLDGPVVEAEAAGRRAASAAARATRSATRAAVQVHGGYGYIREYAVERFMRDAISSAARAGGSEIAPPRRR